jgi:hypothetical protein
VPRRKQPKEQRMPPAAAPLAVQWTAETDLGPISAPLVGDEGVVVAAGEGGMTGLDARTGAVRWRLAAAGTVTDLTATDVGPVMTHFAGAGSTVVAADWQGEVVWSMPGGPSMGVRSLRGCGDRLLAKGEAKTPERRLVYRLWRAADGSEAGVYPGEVALPFLTRHGLVYPVRSSDEAQAGLHLQTLDDRPPSRLLPDSHAVIGLRDDVVVFDTTDGPWEPSELVAYDLAARRELWRVAGGPVLSLALDAAAVGCARLVDVTIGTVALRDLRTGALLWETAPQDMTDLTAGLLGGWLLAEVNAERLKVYDLGSGALLQELANETSLVLGPCLTPAGLYDADGAAVRCLWRPAA